MPNIEFPQDIIDFAGYDDSTRLSKQEIQGERLWNLIFKRDNNFGGFLVGLFGIMGSGKTSLMLQAADRIKKEYPDEIIFWREPLGNPLQIPKIGNKYQILCERRYPVKVMRMHPHGLSPSDDINIRMFTGFRELFKLVDPGLINLVYFNRPWYWIKLIDQLKTWGSWQTLFFDEMEDILPGRCRGKQWEMNELFCNSIKEIRKARISTIYNTQNQMDIDYRLRSKTMLYFYLYGARYDDYSPVWKNAIQGLEIGQGWIDYGHSIFGLINFKPVYPKEETYIILPTDRRKKSG